MNEVTRPRQYLFDPRDYGATSGGAASVNLAAITAAMTEAAAMRGAVAFAELYPIDAFLDVPSHCTLQGSGAGTGVKVANGANVSAIRAGGSSGAKRTNITIRNLEIDGNKENQTSLAVSHGINANWCDDLTVEGCYIHDTNRNGILALGSRPTIRGNRLIDCGEVTSETAAGRSGIIINRNSGDASDASPNAIVSNNIVISYAEHGIKLYENCHDSIVHGNIVMSTVASSWWGIYVTGCCRVSVIGNRVDGAIYYGIQVTDENSGGAMIDCVVANNVVTESSLDNINVSSLTATSARVVVSGNIVKGGGQDGIAVARVPYSAVTGNIASDGDRHGISVYRSNRTIVQGNQAVNNGQGGAPSSGFRIWDDNTTAQEYLTIIGNHAIDDQGSPTQDYGFTFQNLAANNYCAHNIAAGNSAAQWNGVPASNTMRDNIGYVTKNGGVASKANGGSIAHGLAATPTRYGLTPTVAKHIAAVTAVDGTYLSVALHDDTGTAVSAAENVSWWAEV